MKKLFIVFLFLIVIISTNVYAQISNGEAVTNIALMVSRFQDWERPIIRTFNSRWRGDTFYGPGTIEDHLFQEGAFKGVARELSELIDWAISLDLRRLQPRDYIWLKNENSNAIYKTSQIADWQKSLSTEHRRIFDRGFAAGRLSVTGMTARLPDILSWRN